MPENLPKGNNDETARPGSSSWWMLIVILGLLSIVFQGHQFGIGNNTIDIAWILRTQSGGSFLPNDWYLSTAVYHPNVIVPLSWLASIVPLDVTFLLAHVLTRLIFCFGVFYLAYFMFANRGVALLAIVTAILFPRISLGGHYAQAAHFEASFFGFSLATLALAFLVQALQEKRFYIFAAVVLGILLNMHLFIGLSLLAVMFIQILLDQRHRRFLLIAILLALVIAAPTLFSVAGEYFSQVKTISSRDVAEILAFRHPHHHSPFTWEPLVVVEFLYYTLFWLVLQFLLPSRGKLTERLVFMYVVVTSLVHLVFVEIVPVGFVAYLQSFRQTVFFTVFATIYLGAYAIELGKRQALLGIGIAVLLVISFRIPLVFIPLSAASLIAYVISIRKMPIRRSVTLRLSAWPSLLIPLLVVSLALLVAGAMGWLNPVFRKALGQSEHFRRSYLSTDAEFNDICLWIKSHTACDASFIIPPTVEGFRIIAQRACIVDYKSVTFRQLELWEWFDRIARLGQLLKAVNDESLPPYAEDYSRIALQKLHQIRFAIGIKDLLDGGYRSLSAEDIDKLAQRYHANYVLTYTGLAPYKLKRAYANREYVVYQILPQ